MDDATRRLLDDLLERVARLEASVSTRDYAVPRPGDQRTRTLNIAFAESVVAPVVASTPEEEDAARRTFFLPGTTGFQTRTLSPDEYASYLRLRDQGLTTDEALADLGEPDPETAPVLPGEDRQ